ncbi:MAG: coenzyme F420-0:L-glutamate ligase [Methanobrevibacter sp.]|jgi:F420-0:gamma-glutamyl ligase-like protein|nr:coenzyme F420-0:L-glutamate ligase [Candidatus Methanovirga australis]
MNPKQKLTNNKEYILLPIETNYIKPNDSLDIILNKSIDLVEDHDYLVIAETPIAISQGRLVDESDYTPSIQAKFLAFVWSKYIWGYILGPILKIKKRTMINLRKLPSEAAQHKEVVLQLYGWKHGLKPASEAGIDLSNVPGTFVSLLPKNPDKIAKNISKTLKELSGKDVNVLIVDSDATYKIKNKYFTGVPIAIPPIKANMGIWAYILGQIFSNCGPTIIASSSSIDIREGLKIANICEEYQKLNSNIETVHDMKKKLDKDDVVSVEDLDSIVHTPAIIVRKTC